VKLPQVDQIRKEDMPDAPDWINVIISAMDRFNNFVYRALDRNINEDNIDEQIKTFDISQNEITTGYGFKSELKRVSPRMVILGKIVEKNIGYHNPITSAVHIDWVYEDGLIKIKNITGIDSSKEYTVTVLVR
jgi:hypothetical protein